MVPKEAACGSDLQIAAKEKLQTSVCGFFECGLKPESNRRGRICNPIIYLKITSL